jgi:hypothetical protein
MSQPAAVLSYPFDLLLSKCVPGFANKTAEEQTFIQNEIDEALDTLCENGLVIFSTNDDEERVYTGTSHSHSFELSLVEKSIYNCLKAHKTIFNSIVLDCQLDKSSQTGKFILEAIRCAVDYEENKGTLPIIIHIGVNSQSLTDQTFDGLKTQLCLALGVENNNYDEALFALKSNEKRTINDIKNYIDAYSLSYRENLPIKKLPPVILALNNPTQIKKVLEIVKEKVLDILSYKKDWPLRIVFAIDEVDEVWPVIREKFKPCTIDSTIGVSAVLGVTATEGNLVDDFPEWASSNQRICEIDPSKAVNHRSISHKETKIKHNKQGSKESNNDYALRIIKENINHFKNPFINPRNQQQYYRKTIVLGNYRVEEQKSFANTLNGMGFHTLLYNGDNLKLRRYNTPDWIPINLKKGKKVLRKELFRVFRDYDLWNCPAVIIGNKKMDRGIGFHHAPPGGGRGLIWTDEIMGYIEGRDATKVQKLSRLNGVIAQCEDYPNELLFWTDPRTDVVVRNTNSIITELKKNFYNFHPLKERMETAKENAQQIGPPDENGAIGETDEFDTHEAAANFIRRIKPNARIGAMDSYLNQTTGLYQTSLTSNARPYTIEEYRDADKNFTESSLLDVRNGVSYRLMPMYNDGTFTDIKWYVRWATTEFECGENITKDEVLTRKYEYDIEINEYGPLIIRVERKSN